MMINNTFIEKKDNTVDIIKSYERKQYFTEVYGHRPLDFRLIKSILIDVYHMNNAFLYYESMDIEYAKKHSKSKVYIVVPDTFDYHLNLLLLWYTNMHRDKQDNILLMAAYIDQCIIKDFIQENRKCSTISYLKKSIKVQHIIVFMYIISLVYLYVSKE